MLSSEVLEELVSRCIGRAHCNLCSEATLVAMVTPSAPVPAPFWNWTQLPSLPVGS